jgi:hypothetical protein
MILLYISMQKCGLDSPVWTAVVSCLLLTMVVLFQIYPIGDRVLLQCNPSVSYS